MTDNLKDLTTDEQHYDDTARTIEALTELAHSRECDLVEANDSLLLIDLDSAEAVEDFHDNYEWFNERSWLGKATFWKSRNDGTHIQIELTTPRPLVERVLLQRLLGSDPVRESLTLLRIWRVGSDPVVLFRPRGAEVRPLHGADDDLPF